MGIAAKVMLLTILESRAEFPSLVYDWDSGHAISQAVMQWFAARNYYGRSRSKMLI